jgi:hypothetical protein
LWRYHASVDFLHLPFVRSFFPFSSLFLLSIGIYRTQQTTRFLYNHLERQMLGNSLLLTVLSIFVLPWLTFAFCFIEPFFLKSSNEMAMDIGSLAPVLDEHELRLGVKTKRLRKNGEPLAFLLLMELRHSRPIWQHSIFSDPADLSFKM